ncbi:MAG: hypothetical protein KAZ28_01720 [Bacteroidaceae bacterium]|nr:hypothetical protein [Bacteroidaceae bacterium]
MANLKIIKSIRLNKNGVQVKDANFNWINLHKQQGDLDGACSVYSLFMALLCQGLISEEDTHIYATPDRRTEKGKLLYHFFYEQGFVREGYSYSILAREFNEISSEIKATHKKPRSNDDRIEMIESYTNQNTPVIISTQYKDGAHALLAIGVECDDDDIITKILCVDPSAPAPKVSPWNCFIDVSREGKVDYPFYCVTCSNSYKVTLDDMLIIERI